jgi:hypothetical protein
MVKHLQSRLFTTSKVIAMFNRRKLDRERMEVYLMYIFMAYRRWIFICGLLLLILAMAVMLRSVTTGSLLMLLAFPPLLMGVSYSAILFMARLGAWMATVGRKV